MLAPLRTALAGKLCGDEGNHVECPYHGLQFAADGTCVVNPHGTGKIPSSLHIRAYPVVERHTLLWVWMGDQPANADLIPDFSHLDEDAPGIVSKRDWMIIDVDYRLMSDNLLDLSHVNFLHEGLFGHAGMVAADVELRDEVEPSGLDTLYVTRTCKNVAPSYLFDLMYRNDGQPARHVGRDALERTGIPPQPRRGDAARCTARRRHDRDRLAPADADQ